jgi:hypothetical protein
METKKSDPLPWLGIGIKVFGVVMFVVCTGLLIWSLFRPPVTDGPPLPDPFQHSVQQK